MENNNSIAQEKGGNTSDQHPTVSLGDPAIMPLPSLRPSSSREHSLFYVDGGTSAVLRPAAALLPTTGTTAPSVGSSAVFRPPAVALLPTTVTRASSGLLPRLHSSSLSSSGSNNLNTYLINQHHQQHQLEHERIQHSCPPVQLLSSQVSDVNRFTVSGSPSFIEQKNSQSMSGSSNNCSNTVDETVSPEHFSCNSSSNNNSLFMISSGASQETSTTTASAVTSQSNSQSLRQNSQLISSVRHLSDFRPSMNSISTEFNSPMACSSNTFSSSGHIPSSDSITFVNNLSNSSSALQFVDQSIGGFAPLNAYKVLSSLPSSSRTEAPSASVRQSFAPVVTSNVNISRSTSSASSPAILHNHKNLPVIMSSIYHHSRGIPSNSRSNEPLDAGQHLRGDLPASHSRSQSSMQNQNSIYINHSPDPLVGPLPINTAANMPGSSFNFRHVNQEFLPVSAMRTDNNAPQLIPEIHLEPNEAHPVVLEEPSASGARESHARIFASHDMFSTEDEECLVSSSTEKAVASAFSVDESRMGSSTNLTMPLLDSTVDSTGDPTPLECLDSPADVYAASPVDSNSSSIDEADTDLVSTVRYPRNAIISASSLKDIALATFPPISLYSDSSDDDDPHMSAGNFSSRNHHRFSSSPLKPYQPTSSGSQRLPMSALSPSSSTFSAFTKPSSAGPSHREGLHQKALTRCTEEGGPEHMDEDSSSQDSVEGVASSLELGLASAGHGLGCSDSVARSTPLLPPAQILERETPSPPHSPHDGVSYQQDLQEYDDSLPSITTGNENNGESSTANLGSGQLPGTSGFVPVRASLHSSDTAPQYQLSSVGDSTRGAHEPRGLPSSLSYTTVYDYTVTGSTSSAGTCSSVTFSDHSLDSPAPSIKNKIKLCSGQPEIVMAESTRCSTVLSNAECQKLNDPTHNWSDINTSTSGKINCTSTDLPHSVSSARTMTTASRMIGSAAGSSYETSFGPPSTTKLSGKTIDTSITLDLGKRNSLMSSRTEAGLSYMHSVTRNDEKTNIGKQATTHTVMSHGHNSATSTAAPVMSLVCPLQSETVSLCSQSSNTDASTSIISSSAAHETVSVAGLFGPVVPHVPSPRCSAQSSTCTSLSTSNVQNLGSMADTEGSYSSVSGGEGLSRRDNMHSLFHSPTVFKTRAPTSSAMSNIKESSSRPLEAISSFSQSSLFSTLPKKVLMSTGRSEILSSSTMANSTSTVTALSESTCSDKESFFKMANSTSAVTALSESTCSDKESFFKPIPTPSTHSSNKEDYHLKANLVTYEFGFDNTGNHCFSNEDYLPPSPSSALLPSAPCSTNSRYVLNLNFNADVPATQSQPLNFSAIPPDDAASHNPERHASSPSKFDSCSSATLDPRTASLNSTSSTLSPLTLSFNSSNSLLGSSFEIFPSSHSSTEKVTSQQPTNSPAAAAGTTTYTVSSSSLKRDPVGVLENTIGPGYAKFKNGTPSVPCHLQDVGAPTVHPESDTNKFPDDYFGRSVLDHMRLIGDPYENQEGSSSSSSFSSRIVGHSIEHISNDDHREQMLKHEGKRHSSGGVSSLERGYGGVAVAVVESLHDKSTNTIISEVAQTPFTGSEMICGASSSVEDHKSHAGDLVPEQKYTDKFAGMQHHHPREMAQDKDSNLLTKRRGDKSDMVQLHSKKDEAEVQDEKEHSSNGVVVQGRVSRRSIKRPRASPPPSKDELCRECVESGGVCSLHSVESITDGHSISDRTVLSRAWASLPSHHLSIRRLPASNKDARQYGVFSKRRVDQHTFFGPMVGVAKPDVSPLDHADKASISSSSLTYKFTRSNGEVMILDTSDMEKSNWMSFVGAAATLAQQNCVVVEREDGDVYFFTSRSIPPAAQLRVGYSKQYAAKYGFQALQPTPQEIQAAEERDTWPCYECDARLTSSADLQQHLSTHEVNEQPKRRGRARSRLTFKRRRKTGARQASKVGKKTPAPEASSVSSPIRGPADGVPALLSCLVCDKTFTNNKVLTLHQLQHGRPDSGAQHQLAEALVCPQCGHVLASRDELLSHVESHEVPPTELRHRREGPPPAVAATVDQGGEERPRHSQAPPSLGTAPSAEEAPVELGPQAALVTKLYDCPICRQEMLSLQQLRAHLPHHVDDQGNYHCPTCGRDFDSYRKVRRHIRAYCFNVLHCQECNRPFPSVVKLKMHMLTHSDRRDFKCDMCESSFKRKDKLRDHQKRVHGPNNTRPTRPVISVPSVAAKKDKAQVSDAEAYRYRNSAYQCRLCLLGFKRRGMLVNHTLKRHPELSLGGVPDLNKPLESSTMEYHCPHCSKVYRSNIRRKLHLSKAHPGSQPLPPNSLVTKASPTVHSDTGCEGGPAAPADPPRYAVRCNWCHREYLTKAKLNQHHRKYHRDKLLGADKETTHLQQQEQVQTGAASAIEVASGSSLYEEIKPHKPWDQSIISYYVDNNNVARQLELNGKMNGVTQTEFVVYNSDPSDGGGNNSTATNATGNDDINSKFSNTKGLATGDLLTQAMGVICLDLNNANVASASASNNNSLVNDGQANKHHSTQSAAGPIILTGGDGTLTNAVLLGPLPANQTVSALTPASSVTRENDQQQNAPNAKAPSAGELITWTLLSPDTGNTYTIALPPGQLIQLAPNVIATTNTGIVVDEGVTYSTVVPVSR